MPSPTTRRLKIATVLLAAALMVGVAGTVIAGSRLGASSPSAVGPPPPDLLGASGAERHARAVVIPSGSGQRLQGWLVPGTKGRGAVVLMHGIHSNRLSMLPRARFLARAEYTVLLFDFQAHGESGGDHQTFGFLESRDARAAVAFLRSRAPGERIGAIGSSLGGAAAVLGTEPLDVQAMVLEAVYPTIEEATSNRIAERLGPPGRWLTPLLLCQLHPRLGISVADLRPIDRIGAVKCPVLIIAGGRDACTPPEESRRLFAAAREPKEYWEIPEAAHQDFHAFATTVYEARLLAFLGPSLTSR